MEKIKLIAGAVLASALIYTACDNTSNQQQKNENIMKQNVVAVSYPTADKWVNSPLRNRLKLDLKAKVEDVWSLVGDPANMPQYSEGLQKVETEFDNRGNFEGYTCIFKPMEGEHEGIIHHSRIVWHAINTGWAAIDPEENPFGLRQSLSLMTLEAAGERTIFKWQFHFNCESEEILILNKEGYHKALDDISEQLIQKFGGVQLENFMDVSPNVEPVAGI